MRNQAHPCYPCNPWLFNCPHAILRLVSEVATVLCYRRYLRIVFSVTCAIACVLLIALWVRSYWRCDGIYKLYKNGMVLAVASNNGGVRVLGEPRNSIVFPTRIGWKLRSQQVVAGFSNFRWSRAPNIPYVVIPLWLPVLISATLAAAPWIRWSNRFSLRTLFIATTLIAVVLGAIVYVSR